MMTEKQAAFIKNLLAEREIPDEAREQIESRLASGEITKKRASNFIERLLKAPLKKGADAPAPAAKIRVEYKEVELDDGKIRRMGAVIIPGVGHVLAGRYALDATDLPGDFTNDVLFLRVWVGDRGGWKVVREISDDVQHEFDAWPLKRAAIEKIAADPSAASSRYGHEFERCGVCGRGLRKDESRAAGIGPVCAGRVAAW